VYEAYPYEKQLETIFCVDKASVFYNLPAQANGVIPIELNAVCTALRWAVSWMPRKMAEMSQSVLHWIPYGPILKMSATGDFDLAVYQRPTKNNGEARLAGKYSCGWAGHVDVADQVIDHRSVVNVQHTLTKSFLREISEEAVFTLNGEVITVESRPDIFRIVVMGLIYDNTDNVGLTHLGVAYAIIINNPDVQISSVRPDEIVNPHFIDLSLVESKGYDFENWSKFLVAELSKDYLSKPQTSVFTATSLGEMAGETDLAMDDFIAKYRSTEPQTFWTQVERDGKTVWEHPALKALIDGDKPLTDAYDFDTEEGRVEFTKLVKNTTAAADVAAALTSANNTVRGRKGPITPVDGSPYLSGAAAYKTTAVDESPEIDKRMFEIELAAEDEQKVQTALWLKNQYFTQLEQKYPEVAESIREASSLMEDIIKVDPRLAKQPDDQPRATVSVSYEFRINGIPLDATSAILRVRPPQ
jgi:predicted NUDIX family phosphoesterase